MPKTRGWSSWKLYTAVGVAAAALVALAIDQGVLLRAWQRPTFSAPIAAVGIAPVRITTPLPGNTFLPAASIEISAIATGAFVQVDFYAGSTLIGSDRTAPYSATWANAPVGPHQLTAVARNLRGTPTYATPVQVSVRSAEDLPLVQKTSFRYEGAFRLPQGRVGTSSFDYAGPIAYNRTNDSLFIVGHTHQQQVAEISIPELVTTTRWQGQNLATVLQTFVDLSEGKAKLVNPADANAIYVGGLLPFNDKLVFSAYSYYDGNGAQKKSHFTSSTRLTERADVQGPFQLSSPKAGYVSGYMGVVPPGWRQALGGAALTGQCCIPIISRTSSGPAVFAFNPADLTGTATVPTSPLAYFPEEAPLVPWGSTSPLFNGSSLITGVVFPEGTRSVLFFGRQGTGRFCYGDGAKCGDPEFQDSGTHAFPYVYQVWAYDALELAEVNAGRKQPWLVRPYAYWQMTFPQKSWATSINGATYDPATGRLFVSQAFAEGPRPLIHVYTLDLTQ